MSLLETVKFIRVFAANIQIAKSTINNQINKKKLYLCTDTYKMYIFNY